MKSTIVVKLATGLSAYDPTGMFGRSTAEAAALMRAAAAEGLGVGLAIDLNTENPHPAMYRHVLGRVGDTVRAARVQPELIDIDDNFPPNICDMQSPLLADFCHEIRRGPSASPGKAFMHARPGLGYGRGYFGCEGRIAARQSALSQRQRSRRAG